MGTKNCRSKRIKICRYVLLALVAAGVVGTLTFCFYKINKESRIRQAKYLTAEANRLMADGDVTLAQLLLLEALPEHLVETEVALRQSLDMNTIVLQESKVASELKISSDDKYIMGYSYVPSKCLNVWKTSNGEQVGKIPLHDDADVCFGEPGFILILDSILKVYDINKKTIVRKIYSPILEKCRYLKANPTGKYVMISSGYSESRYVMNLEKTSYYELPWDGEYISHEYFINDSLYAYSSDYALYCIELYSKRYRRHVGVGAHYNVFNDKYLISKTDDNGKDIVAVFGDKKSEYVYENYTIELNVGQISPSGRYFAAVDSFDNIVIYDLYTHEVYRRIKRDCYDLDHSYHDVMYLVFDSDDRLFCFTADRCESYWVPDGSTFCPLHYPYPATFIDWSSDCKMAFVSCEHSRWSCYYSFDLSIGEYKMSSSEVCESPDHSFILYRDDEDNSIRIENKERPHSWYAEPDTVALLDRSESLYRFANFNESGVQMCIATDKCYVIQGDKVVENDKICGEYIGYCTDPDLLLTCRNWCLHVWNPKDGKLLKKIPLPKHSQGKDIYRTDAFYDVMKEKWIVEYAFYTEGEKSYFTEVSCNFDTDDMTLELESIRPDTVCSLYYVSNPKTTRDRRWSANYSDGDVMVITDGRAKTYHNAIYLSSYSYYNSDNECEFSPSGNKLLIQRQGIQVFDVKTCQSLSNYSYLQKGMEFIAAMAFSFDEKSIYYVEEGLENTILFRVDFESIDHVRKRVEECLDGRKLTDNERKKYNLSIYIHE